MTHASDNPIGIPTGWTFLSNHGHVLMCIARDPDTRLREIAERVGISERAVFSIIDDLERDGYVVRIRNGRRNRYVINTKRPLRHPVEHPSVIGDLLAALPGETTMHTRSSNPRRAARPTPAAAPDP